MTDDYIESVWWALRQIWDAGRLYQGYKVVPYCPRCGTALSSHEVAQGYKDVVDPSVYVRLPVTAVPPADEIPESPVQAGDNLLVWTTTPWTLISHAAVAAGAEIEYVRAKPAGSDEVVILAAPLAERVLGEGFESLASFPGSALEGRPLRGAVRLRDGRGLRPARPLRSPGRLRHDRRRHRPGPHRARLRRGRLPPGRGARHDASEPGQAGRHLRRARPGLPGQARLRAQPGDRRRARGERPAVQARWTTSTPTRTAGAAAPRSSTTPSRAGTSARPRCATACSPRTRRSAGIPTTSSTGASASGWRTTSTGRSRASATGARRCRSGSATRRIATRSFCAGSLEELRDRGGEIPDDLHRPYVDDIVFGCERDGCEGQMRRVPEVIDTWFDSGSMPFAQFHHPFEGAEEFEQPLPRPVHLRGARPDARLVLLAPRRLDARLRPERRMRTASAWA